ncbi:SDR family NAD(P)-dependent oxidoreductase [Mucilaginibacter corticis]|uniref:SDR family NAD(P)-dependent oxidoreductase n=1 Tax=Mucilaginibacter corticis TaxID=2597670 RepID=A0A556MV30_9SPHI|nr:SDR family NAD(P)-dependent oxidoreductase [Mucilaginibacter corticis]TSJ43659.1 SDR family NAD(P)-dependent oxidoreductase [Mucilaginibacter corticis]
MKTKENKVWYITGASKGLGLSLVKRLLLAGNKVAATSRTIDALKTAVGDVAADLFLPLAVDLSNDESIHASIQKAVETFGKIDVVVNNAGYGIGGSVEELSGNEVVDCFNINVFAAVNVIKYVLPVMRAQRSGHIINISSIAGFAPATGWSLYAATKYALIGISEVLAQDVKEFGIKVTVAAPGAFRTEFLTEQSLVLAKNQIADYKAIRESQERMLAMDGKQAGDPDKAADIFIQLAEMDEPPVRLFMGTDAYNRASQKIEALATDLEKWKELSFATDYRQQPNVLNLQ